MRTDEAGQCHYKITIVFELQAGDHYLIPCKGGRGNLPEATSKHMKDKNEFGSSQHEFVNLQI